MTMRPFALNACVAASDCAGESNMDSYLAVSGKYMLRHIAPLAVSVGVKNVVTN